LHIYCPVTTLARAVTVNKAFDSATSRAIRSVVLAVTIIVADDGFMQHDEFMDKLIPQVSLDEIDFACDLERVLAEQVKYLRGVLATIITSRSIESNALIDELRSYIADKDREISRLREENGELRQRLLPNPG